MSLSPEGQSNQRRAKETRPLQSSGFRGDIQGLRAIAVLLVVAFHLEARYVPGGFVGVDVFFVISGYLITPPILSGVAASRFSMATFYERRLRRIAPALLVMLSFSTVAASTLLFPGELIGFAKSLIASVLGVANVYFWLSSNYFEARNQILLHVWSLAVEEQFYLVIPLLLIALQRLSPKHLRSGLAWLAAASFLWSAFTIRPFPSATFYLLPARAWELLLGSLLSTGFLPSPKSRITCELCAALGLTAIIISSALYKSGLPFPGPLALAPCLGALMILAAGEQRNTVVGRALSFAPLAGIGMISYSLYLYHVPLISLENAIVRMPYQVIAQRYLGFLSLSRAIHLERDSAILVASFVCAFFSWRFVEQPFRTGSNRPSARSLFWLAGSAAALLVCVGTAELRWKGMPGRFSNRAINIEAYAHTYNYGSPKCFLTRPGQALDRSACLSESDDRPNMLLLGDSQAAQLDEGLAQVYPGIHFMQAEAVGCMPVPERRAGEQDNCVALMRFIYDDYLVHHHVDRVIVAAFWQPYDVARLDAAIRRLKDMNQNVTVVGPIVQYDSPLPRLLATSVEENDPRLADRHRITSYDQLDAELAHRARSSWHVPYISYNDLLCSHETCLKWSASDVPLQWDWMHLTRPGALLIAERFKRANLLAP